MRTLLAPGPTGRPLMLLGQSCAKAADGARVLFARIKPAAAQGAYAAGTVDADGFGLHIRYSVPAEDAVPHTDYPGVAELESTRDLVVDFGPGTHWLNYPGEVSLVGGAGLWLVDIQIRPVAKPHPHWHSLRRSVLDDAAFEMPHAHEEIGSYNESAILTMSDDAGVTQLRCLVGAVPVPASGTVTVSNTGSDDRSLWIFTRWFG